MNREQTALCLNRQHRRSDGQQEGAERDWTKQYRLAAGVYVMRGGQILMLERARGMMTGFWSVPGGIVDPEGGGCVRKVGEVSGFRFALLELSCRYDGAIAKSGIGRSVLPCDLPGQSPASDIARQSLEPLAYGSSLFGQLNSSSVAFSIP